MTIKLFHSPSRMQLRASLGIGLAIAALAFVSSRPGAVAAGAGPLETRCGWLSNPTPANVWLYDREGEWTIGVQGGYQAKGDWSPENGYKQWTETNGHYGYGCTCMRMRVDKRSHRVIEIQSVKERPLAACRQDPALKKWQKNL